MRMSRKRIKTTSSSQLSPAKISVLPVEVLRYIHELVYLGQRCKTTSSVTLSHVCRLWRLVTLDNPRLWNHIRIYLPWNLEEIKIYLRRAKNFPVDVKLLLDFSGYDWSQAKKMYVSSRFRALGRLLSQQHGRLRKLDIRVEMGGQSSEDPVSDLLRLFADKDMPILEDFTLYAYDLNRLLNMREPPSSRVVPFRSTPLLKTLGMGRLALAYWLPNFSTVTNLYLSAVTYEFIGTPYPTLQDILKTCSRIEHLRVSREWPMDHSDDVCEVPTLRTCYFFGPDQETSVVPFLSSVIAPNLVELVLPPNWHCARLDFCHDPPRDMSVFPSLRSLTINAPVSCYTFSGLTKFFSHVTHLIVGYDQAASSRTIAEKQDRLDLPRDLLRVFPNLLELSLTRPPRKVFQQLSDIITGEDTKRDSPKFETLFVDKKTFKKLLNDGFGLEDYPYVIREGDAWEKQVKEFILD